MIDRYLLQMRWLSPEESGLLRRAGPKRLHSVPSPWSILYLQLAAPCQETTPSNVSAGIVQLYQGQADRPLDLTIQGTSGADLARS
jgi:hypothetical protein